MSDDRNPTAEQMATKAAVAALTLLTFAFAAGFALGVVIAVIVVAVT